MRRVQAAACAPGRQEARVMHINAAHHQRLIARHMDIDRCPLGSGGTQRRPTIPSVVKGLASWFESPRVLLRLEIACGNRARWMGLLAPTSRARREQQSRAKWQPAAGDTLVVSEEPQKWSTWPSSGGRGRGRRQKLPVCGRCAVSRACRPCKSGASARSSAPSASCECDHCFARVSK